MNTTPSVGNDRGVDRTSGPSSRVTLATALSASVALAPLLVGQLVALVLGVALLLGNFGLGQVTGG